VYEEEEHYFFHDFSDQVIQDDHLARLMTFPNVIMTSHQGFLTYEALNNIAETVLKNINDFEKGRPLINQVGVEKVINKPIDLKMDTVSRGLFPPKYPTSTAAAEPSNPIINKERIQSRL